MESKDKITVSQLPKTSQPQITTETHQEKGWKFIFKKSGILPSKELDQICDELNLQGIPDVVYGNNVALLINEDHNIVYEISPQDSLSFCNFSKQKENFKETFDTTPDIDSITVIPTELKIKQAEFWKHKKVSEDADIKVLEKISDWTYSTPYKGSIKKIKTTKIEEDLKDGIEKLSISSESKIYLAKTDEEIPLNNLTASNPIKWFSEFLLFEDELGDCGLSQSTFRFRAMGDCFFGLLRSYLRVDDVCVRIYDTRIYHEFGKNYILREFSTRENTFDELKKKGFKFDSEFITNHRQSDIVYQSLDLKSVFRDKVIF